MDFVFSCNCATLLGVAQDAARFQEPHDKGPGIGAAEHQGYTAACWEADVRLTCVQMKRLVILKRDARDPVTAQDVPGTACAFMSKNGATATTVVTRP